MPGESIWQRPDLAAADAYREEIARYVDAMAELEAQSMGWIEPAHKRTLAEFSEWMRVRPFDDPILWMLWEVESALGKEDAEGERVEGYAPGVEQRGVLQNAGCGLTAAEPREVAANLVIAGLRDMQNKMRKNNTRLQRGQEDARQLAAVREEVKEAKREAANARSETEEARQEARNLQQQIAFLRDRLPTQPEPAEAKPKPPGARRVKVEGHAGVYRRPGSGEYEIGWREDGRQRWETIGPDLDHAIRAREEKIAQTEKESVAA